MNTAFEIRSRSRANDMSLIALSDLSAAAHRTAVANWLHRQSADERAWRVEPPARLEQYGTDHNAGQVLSKRIPAN